MLKVLLYDLRIVATQPTTQTTGANESLVILVYALHN